MSTSDSMSKFKPLSNSNYPEWSGEMRAWLMKNGLWRLVSRKETQPKDKQDLDKWEAKAERAAGEIYLLVENCQGNLQTKRRNDSKESEQSIKTK